MASSVNTLVAEEAVGSPNYVCLLLALTTLVLLMHLYLLYLILYESPVHMHEYRRYLIQILVSAGSLVSGGNSVINHQFQLWDFIYTALFGYGLLPDMLYPSSCMVSDGLFGYFGHSGALAAVRLAY